MVYEWRQGPVSYPWYIPQTIHTIRLLSSFFFFFFGWGVGGGVGGGGGGEGWIGQLYEYPSVLLVVLITYYFTDIMEITLSFQSQ